jgi:hypothetical protein
MKKRPLLDMRTTAYKAGEVAGAGVATNAGDYNADGTNSDLPNIPTYGYKIPTDRNHQLGRTSNLAPITATTNGSPSAGYNGVFTYLTDFTNPSTLPGEGNEVINGYRSPGYANTDFALLKNNRIHEFANLQLRLEVFNLFNPASLGGITSGTTVHPLARRLVSTTHAFCNWERASSSSGIEPSLANAIGSVNGMQLVDRQRSRLSRSRTHI